jgi:hypothetical protein
MGRGEGTGSGAPIDAAARRSGQDVILPAELGGHLRGALSASGHSGAEDLRDGPEGVLTTRAQLGEMLRDGVIDAELEKELRPYAWGKLGLAEAPAADPVPVSFDPAPPSTPEENELEGEADFIDKDLETVTLQVFHDGRLLDIYYGPSAEAEADIRRIVAERHPELVEDLGF